MKSYPIQLKKGCGRSRKRSLTRQFADFLSKNGILKLMHRICLRHKRKKKDNGISFLLEFVFSKLWQIGSAYTTNINLVPKTVQCKFGIQRFAPKSTFYDEIPSTNTKSLETFNDALANKAIARSKRIIVMLDSHAVEVWSKRYAEAAWGATSSDHKFFGFKMFATIIHGLDVAAKHLLVPANKSATPFACGLIEETLCITNRIDVLLMDREFTDFTFWAWLIEKSVGFIIPAKDDNAVTKTLRRTLNSKVFLRLNEHTEYYESIAYFPDLRQNLRIVFIKKKVIEKKEEKIKEYELITNLPSTYSTIEVITLYPLRQGREDVFDRLKNEFDLHKPCKIKDFAGIEAFVALTITAYNLYSLFSHNLFDCYKTIVVLYRAWLFNEPPFAETVLFNEPKKTARPTPSRSIGSRQAAKLS